MGSTTKAIYDADFAEWAEQTAELIRAGQLGDVDLKHVAEEIGDLASGEQRAVRSQLKRLLLHLIKLRIQPEKDGASWHASIEMPAKKFWTLWPILPACVATWKRIWKKFIVRP